MKLGTRGRYAVLALVDLTLHQQEDPISLADIAMRQNLSQQYLEQLFGKLRRAEIVQSVRGQAGGYRLARPANTIAVAEVITAVEEKLKATNCSAHSTKSCRGKSSKCLTHNLWQGMDTLIQSYMSTVTLEDIVMQRAFPTAVKIDQEVAYVA